MPARPRAETGGPVRIFKGLVCSRKSFLVILVALHLGVFAILYASALHLLSPSTSGLAAGAGGATGAVAAGDGASRGTDAAVHREMRFEYARADLRRHFWYLTAAWAALLAAAATLVHVSARRSAARVDAHLSALEAGREPCEETAVLPLDPVSAQLHRRLRDVLERRRRRDREVASRLVHADQLATLGQLAAGLAHEIKNPLAGIQGALEVLREDSGEGEAGTLYEAMLAELQRVDGILERLLASARPSPLRPSPTHPAILVREVEQLLGHGLRRRGVVLDVQIGRDVPVVLLDGAKIRQVLINLVHNAADAVGSGGRVSLQVAALPAGGAALITVEDDGPGIPAENRQRIFEPFFSTKFAGTGLGLPIARKLVEQHGGRLDVQSEPGEGTTFFVILPEGAGEDSPIADPIELAAGSHGPIAPAQLDEPESIAAVGDDGWL